MLIISTQGKHIIAKIGKGVSTELFNFMLNVLKLYRSTYRPASNDWLIKPSNYETIVEAMEEQVEVHVDNQQDIDKILSPPVEVKHSRLEFTKADLKVKPLLGKTPYERYQLEDIMRLTSFNRYALYNEMGTGKSYELLTAYDLRRRFQGIKKLVYVTASTGVINAKKELLKFTEVTEDEITIGNKDNRRPFDMLDKNIIIMNYRSFLLISDEYQKDINPKIKDYRKCPIPVDKWLQNQEGMLISDESHNISNPSARQSKALDLMKKFFEYRYEASGTPADIEVKFYNQLKFMDESLVRNLSFSDWKERYYNLGTRFSEFEPTSIKEHMKEELQKYVKMFSVRRFADDVLVIPPMEIRPIYVEMSPLHKDIYQGFTVDEINHISTGGALYNDDLKNVFPTLLMSLDCPDLLLKQEDLSPAMTRAIKKFKFKDHAKVEVLLDILKENEGEKIIIWCSHPHTGFQLQELLKEYNPLILNGETVPPKGMDLDAYKNYIRDQFCSADGPNILIAGFQVLNSAVTMIECSKQIIFEATYNYIEFQQALKRIHRAGQTKNVTGYHLIYDNSLDVARKKNLENKDFLNLNFFSDKYIQLNKLVDLFNMRGEV